MYVMQQHLATFLRLRGRKRRIKKPAPRGFAPRIKLTENKDNNQ